MAAIEQLSALNTLFPGFGSAIFSNSAALILAPAIIGVIGIVATVLQLLGVFGDGEPSEHSIKRDQEAKLFDVCYSGIIRSAYLVTLQNSNTAKLQELDRKGLSTTNPQKIIEIKKSITVWHKEIQSLEEKIKKGSEVIIVTGSGRGSTRQVKKYTPTEIQQFNVRIAKLNSDSDETLLKFIKTEITDTFAKTQQACRSYCPAHAELVEYYAATDEVKASREALKKTTAGTPQYNQRKAEYASKSKKAVESLVTNISRYYEKHMAKAIKLRNSADGLTRYVGNVEAARKKGLVEQMARYVSDYKNNFDVTTLTPEHQSEMKRILARYNNNEYKPDPQFWMCGRPGVPLSIQNHKQSFFSRFGSFIQENLSSVFQAFTFSN